MGHKNKRVSQSKVVFPPSKKPLVIENPNAYYDQAPVWSFLYCDFEHEKWGLCKSVGYLEDLLIRLKAYEGMKWSDILTDKSGRKNNTKNHPIEVSQIDKDAQARLQKLNLDEFDVVHSLTITGKRRLWGFLIGGVFYTLWFDVDHEIYKVEKPHS